MTDFNPSGNRPGEASPSQVGADLATLRDDFAKLSSSVADLVKAQAGQASAAMRGVVGDARERLASTTADTRERLAGRAADAQGRIMDKAADAQGRIMDRAADAQDRFMAATADLESTIERNPLTAVLIALFIGLLMGALSRSRR
ncbi:MAG: hypothetical protein QOC72_2117 [Methylobacteriaceae bacterium]|jgi:ElaB/YqjD/DUF883 family membrane-anchored ribosome-binding protein|nr:hypothetical protein [Methylobacteriaceae bacterium]